MSNHIQSFSLHKTIIYIIINKHCTRHMFSLQQNNYIQYRTLNYLRFCQTFNREIFFLFFSLGEYYQYFRHSCLENEEYYLNVSSASVNIGCKGDTEPTRSLQITVSSKWKYQNRYKLVAPAPVQSYFGISDRLAIRHGSPTV